MYARTHSKKNIHRRARRIVQLKKNSMHAKLVNKNTKLMHRMISWKIFGFRKILFLSITFKVLQILDTLRLGQNTLR